MVDVIETPKTKYKELESILTKNALKDMLKKKWRKSLKDKNIFCEIDFLYFLLKKVRINEKNIVWEYPSGTGNSDIDFYCECNGVSLGIEITTLNLRKSVLDELKVNREKFVPLRHCCKAVVYSKDMPLRIHNSVKNKLKGGQLLNKPNINIIVLYENERMEANFETLYTAAYGEYRVQDKKLMPTGRISTEGSYIDSLFNMSFANKVLGGVIIFNGYAKYGVINSKISNLDKKLSFLKGCIDFNFQNYLI